MRSTPGLRVKMVGQAMLSAIAVLSAIFAEVMVGPHLGILRDHCRLSTHQHLVQDGGFRVVSAFKRTGYSG